MQARVLLFLIRFTSGKAFADIALDFDIDEDTAKNTYQDILMYMLMHDPNLPTIWDDSTATEDEIENFLLNLKNQQSPGIKKIQDAFRTPDGRECVAVLYDTTYFPTTNSLDALFQMDHYSGKRGHGHCELGGAITSCRGDVAAVTPGLKVAATPRGGDGITLGLELGQADKLEQRLGFSRLLKGTRNIGVLFVTDRGFKYIPHNINLGDNPTPIEWCLNNDVQCIWPFKTGEKCFTYDEVSNLLEEVLDNQDETLANNRSVTRAEY